MQTHRDAVLGPHDPHALRVVPLEGDGGYKPLQAVPGGGIGKVHLHLQLAGVQIRHQVRISSDPDVELLVDQLRLIALGTFSKMMFCTATWRAVMLGKVRETVATLGWLPQGDAPREG